MPMTSRPVARGFTLVEVMVALFVIAIGLLALARLQISGMWSSQDSNLRNIASQQAKDMAERMRANMVGVREGKYTAASGIPTATNCATTTCDAASLAKYDTSVWNTTNAQRMPAGAGEVACDDLDTDTEALEPGSICTVTLRWDGQRAGVTGTGCDPDDADDLTCLRVVFVP